MAKPVKIKGRYKYFKETKRAAGFSAKSHRLERGHPAVIEISGGRGLQCVSGKKSHSLKCECGISSSLKCCVRNCELTRRNSNRTSRKHAEK